MGKKRQKGVFESLRERAKQALETNYIPPQRYGTAFHINVPFTDVRSLPAAAPRNHHAWDNLSQANQAIILSLDLSDVYLAWQLANGQGQCIVVRRQETKPIRLTGAGLYWIILDAGAAVDLEDEIIGQDVAIHRLFVWQAAGSHFSFTGLRAQTNFLNEKLQIVLAGRQAKAAITHLTYGQDGQQSDLTVAAYHRSPAATSQLHVRSAALGTSKTIYRGLIDVDQVARGTNGYQSGRALLLSRQAVVDQLPQLAIRTNDVRCSHGVTTTHLDDQSLFYLRSRGLPAEAARQLAIKGFFHHQLDIPGKIGKSLETIITGTRNP